MAVPKDDDGAVCVWGRMARRTPRGAMPRRFPRVRKRQGKRPDDAKSHVDGGTGRQTDLADRREGGTKMATRRLVRRRDPSDGGRARATTADTNVRSALGGVGIVGDEVGGWKPAVGGRHELE